MKPGDLVRVSSAAPWDGSEGKILSRISGATGLDWTVRLTGDYEGMRISVAEKQLTIIKGDTNGA